MVVKRRTNPVHWLMHLVQIFCNVEANLLPAVNVGRAQCMIQKKKKNERIMIWEHAQ